MSADDTTAPEDEVLILNAQLLDAIAEGDWDAYSQLVDPEITCFEPEALGHLVDGLEFHRWYFDLPHGGGPTVPRNTTMASPRVWMLGPDAAVVAYIRLTQKIDTDGLPATTQCEETRVWRRQDGRWRHIHFHRSNV
jgi:ketosteroid isomerase-like protein